MSQSEFIIIRSVYPEDDPTDTLWQWTNQKGVYRVVVAYRNREEGVVGCGITNAQAALLFAAVEAE